MKNWNKNKAPTYTKSIERPEVAGGEWEVIYAGVGWRAVGRNQHPDEADRLAYEEATKVAPQFALDKIKAARAAAADRRAYNDMSPEEREAHDNL